MMVTISGNDFHTMAECHQLLQEKLGFPEYYGHNLDALWDCLTGWVELPLTLCWEEVAQSREKLGADAESLLALFQEAQEELDAFELILR